MYHSAFSALKHWMGVLLTKTITQRSCVFLRCLKSWTRKYTFPKMLAWLLALHTASYTLNKQMAPEDKKVDDVHYRCSFILLGTSQLCGPINLEVFSHTLQTPVMLMALPIESTRGGSSSSLEGESPTSNAHPDSLSGMHAKAEWRLLRKVSVLFGLHNTARPIIFKYVYCAQYACVLYE